MRPPSPWINFSEPGWEEQTPGWLEKCFNEGCVALKVWKDIGMTFRGDSSYFASNPQYHMYLHPGYPSYEELIAARDRMLKKHPGLRYVGCHLGSQEWDVDVLVEALDQFPNMSVDMAARISHFKIQDRDRVRNFIIRYQDRLL